MRLNLSSSHLVNTESVPKITFGSSGICIGDPNDTLSAHSVWDAITAKGVSLKDTLDALSDEINSLRVENKMIKLKLLALEGKFTQEEVTNIRKMIISEDQAAKALADSIIQNA